MAFHSWERVSREHCVFFLNRAKRVYDLGVMIVIVIYIFLPHGRGSCYIDGNLMVCT